MIPMKSNGKSQFKQIQHFTYLVLSLILLIYFYLIYTGKYKNIDANSGDPYKLARDYLKKNTGPNDLIISSIRETLTAFYYGKIIEKKIKNIYNNETLNTIYFISNLSKNTGVYLKKFSAQWDPSPGKSERVFSGLHFKRIASFANYGNRGKTIYIFKAPITQQKAASFSLPALSNISFRGNNSACKIQTEKNGIGLSCKKSNFVCANRKISLPVPTGNDFYHLILAKNFMKKATNTFNFHGMLDITGSSTNFIKIGHLANKTFQINPLIGTKKNGDQYQKNFWAIFLSIQKILKPNGLILCLAGNMFENNVLFQGIKVIGFRLKRPVSNTTTTKYLNGG